MGNIHSSTRRSIVRFFTLAQGLGLGLWPATAGAIDKPYQLPIDPLQCRAPVYQGGIGGLSSNSLDKIRLKGTADGTAIDMALDTYDFMGFVRMPLPLQAQGQGVVQQARNRQQGHQWRMPFTLGEGAYAQVTAVGPTTIANCIGLNNAVCQSTWGTLLNAVPGNVTEIVYEAGVAYFLQLHQQGTTLNQNVYAVDVVSRQVTTLLSHSQPTSGAGANYRSYFRLFTPSDADGVIVSETFGGMNRRMRMLWLRAGQSPQVVMDRDVAGEIVATHFSQGQLFVAERSFNSAEPLVWFYEGLAPAVQKTALVVRPQYYGGQNPGVALSRSGDEIFMIAGIDGWSLEAMTYKVSTKGITAKAAVALSFPALVGVVGRHAFFKVFGQPFGANEYSIYGLSCP